MPNTTPRTETLLSSDNLLLLQTIADCGSFAAAARQMNMVPSALSYRVRQLEESLDVLLFDRSSRQAQLTEAGALLLEDSGPILEELQSLAKRVQRVATGWEPTLTLAFDTIIDAQVLLDLCEAFYDLNAPTLIRLREETLSGTAAAVTNGIADLAIGVSAETGPNLRLQHLPLGSLGFIFAVAPHHPLASVDEPLAERMLRNYRAIAVADSVNRGKGQTVGLLRGQPVLTVPDMQRKLQAQLRGLGVGYLPEPLARPWIERGLLVERKVARAERHVQLSCVWRESPAARPGKGLQWWLRELSRPSTRRALLGKQKSRL